MVFFIFSLFLVRENGEVDELWDQSSSFELREYYHKVIIYFRVKFLVTPEEGECHVSDQGVWKVLIGFFFSVTRYLFISIWLFHLIQRSWSSVERCRRRLNWASGLSLGLGPPWCNIHAAHCRQAGGAQCRSITLEFYFTCCFTELQRVCCMSVFEAKSCNKL